MTLTIVTWLWRGWRPVYDRRDVAYLASQLQAHGDLPPGTRILCLTDFPTDWYKARTDLLGVQEYPLWPELPGLDMRPIPQYPWLPVCQNAPNCYRRLKIFDLATQAALGIKPGDLIMSMDLDSIVGQPIRPLLAPLLDNVPREDFAAMGGRVSRIHGSLFAFRAGTHSRVWTEFNPATSPRQLRSPPLGYPRYIGSDQAWLSTVLGDVPLWGPAEGVYSWGWHHGSLRPSDPVTYMSFAGSAKPRGTDCKDRLPWLHAHAMRHWED